MGSFSSLSSRNTWLKYSLEEDKKYHEEEATSTIALASLTNEALKALQVVKESLEDKWNIYEEWMVVITKKV